MICSKCGIDKLEDQYQSYFHSTQQKWRTRRVCKTCFNEQKRKYKESTRKEKIIQPVTPEPPKIDYSTNPLYKNCMDCHEWKLISTDFYTRSDGTVYLNRCRQCEVELERNKRKEYLIDNCGSDKVLLTPNKYTDEYQKDCTFQFLKLLGYIYNEDKGIWTKPGVKELINGKIVFLNLKKTKHHLRKVDQHVLDKIIEYKDKGLNFNIIARKLKLNSSTVRKYYLEWKNMSK
jgi:hypothetical protein